MNYGSQILMGPQTFMNFWLQKLMGLQTFMKYIEGRASFYELWAPHIDGPTKL